ncbi:MAG: hypothetical protein SGPRY_005790 [Prymnesium sp.]
MASTESKDSERDGEFMQQEMWESLALQQRYPRLQNLSAAVVTRRTVEEAELAIKLEREFQSDPSILKASAREDINFRALAQRLRIDLDTTNELLRGSEVLSEEELQSLTKRQQKAERTLVALLPKYLNVTANSGGVADAVPKLRRVIVRARELPLTIDLPTNKLVGPEGFDLSKVIKESADLAVAAKQEEELEALQKESSALLSLRGEATKLRAGIRLVQRQKELKASYLIRLELERIFITLESELSSNSALEPELLPAVEEYGTMESSLISMVQILQQGRHSAIDQEELKSLEADIAQQLLLLGLQDKNSDGINPRRLREGMEVNLRRLQQGLQFYARGIQLLGQDLQLLVNMLTRAITKGYTLRSRERFFPDFFPSQFTEERQKIMSMYSSYATRPTDRSTPSPSLTTLSTNAFHSLFTLHHLSMITPHTSSPLTHHAFMTPHLTASPSPPSYLNSFPSPPSYLTCSFSTLIPPVEFRITTPEVETQPMVAQTSPPTATEEATPSPVSETAKLPQK